MPAASFSISDDLMLLKITHLGTQDDNIENCYVHQQELIYTGRQLAGQAGQ